MLYLLDIRYTNGFKDFVYLGIFEVAPNSTMYNVHVCVCVNEVEITYLHIAIRQRRFSRQ